MLNRCYYETKETQMMQMILKIATYSTQSDKSENANTNSDTFRAETTKAYQSLIGVFYCGVFTNKAVWVIREISKRRYP